MEFDEVREYFPGDDIRLIDWNVTARTGTPHIKKFVEERELTVMLVLDMSMSCHFGSAKQLKSQLAAELCSVLAFSAIKNNDKVGFMAFTDRIEKFVPPRKGLRHVLRVIREALYFKPKGKGTDIASAIEYLSRISKRKTVTFIISDFYAEGFNPPSRNSSTIKAKIGSDGNSAQEDFRLRTKNDFMDVGLQSCKKPLSIANKRHDVIALTITDPRETELPNAGMINLEDAETGKSFLVDTSDRSLREEYKKNSAQRIEERKKLFNSINIDSVDIRTDVPYIESLMKFFKMREIRRR
ncbi:MAG: DUF58 domain-containing protein [Candidatus Omnitrophota bacterium]